MQSLIQKATRIAAWEHVHGVNGVYELRNIRWVDRPADLAGWIDCTDIPQWSANLDDALEQLGAERTGVWIGAGLVGGEVCLGIAWEA